MLRVRLFSFPDRPLLPLGRPLIPPSTSTPHLHTPSPSPQARTMYAEDKRFFPDLLPLSLSAADALWASYPRHMQDESFWGPRPRLRCLPTGPAARSLSLPEHTGTDVLVDARAAGDVAAAAGAEQGRGGGKGGGRGGGRGGRRGSDGAGSAGHVEEPLGLVDPSTTSSASALAAALAAALAIDPQTGSRLILPSEAVGCASRVRVSLGQGAVIFVAVDAPRLQQLLLEVLKGDAFITPGVGVDPTNVFRDGDGATDGARVHYRGQVSLARTRICP